jgi:hypothetical protein
MPMEYSVIKTADWLTITDASGTLFNKGDTVQVTISINSDAELLPGGDYEDVVSFVNHTNHFGDTVRAVTLKVNPSKPIYEWSLDTDPGWTAEGLWAHGCPTGNGGEHGYPDPTSGYTGDNVYGFNLNGDYPNDLPETCLTTEVLDCTGLFDVTLKFQRWLGIEQPEYDHAYVRVSNNGTDWTTVWENTDEIKDGAWSLQEFDISDVADGEPTVYVRWVMGATDDAWPYCGWNIDDVQIVARRTGMCPEWADGDMNDDGFVNGLDIQLFIEGVLGEPTLEEMCCGDFDEDSTLSAGDIGGMVAAMLAP